MQKRIIYRSVLILSLVLSTSCNKYLTLYPQNGTIKQEFWQNKEQLQSAVYGIYSSLIQGTAARGTSDRQMAEILFEWGELRADNVQIGGSFFNDQYSMLQGSILPTNVYTQWYQFYRTINLCNTVLAYGPGVISIDPTLTQTQLNSYMAEALAIRALMYFYLVRNFRDVPLLLTPTATDNDLQLIGKTNGSAILTQILADLNTAEANSTLDYGSTALNKGRVTKWFINTLQADIYLWQYDYADCITACNKVINSGRFGLVLGDGNFFNTVYANGNSNESIFEFQYDGSSTQTNPFYYMFVGGTGELSSQGNVRGVVFPNDPNNPYNVDVRAAIAANSGTSLISKWIGSPNTTAVVSAATSFRHWSIYRYADILMMKAEALAFVTPGQCYGGQALAYVMQIQTRANAIYDPSTSLSVPSDTTDATAVSNYILDERDREFIFEGKRWYDLVRYANRNFPTTVTILTNALDQVVSPSIQQTINAKYLDQNAYYLPIYYNELLLDPNLVQNPYYK